MSKAPEQTTEQRLHWKMRAGEIRAGDLVLFENGERGRLLNWIIRRAQARMLADLALEYEWMADQAARFARFTHAAVVYDQFFCIEMIWPKARHTYWPAKLTPGTHILVRRPRVGSADIPAAIGRLIASKAQADVIAGTPYPTRELVTYYLWSWGVQKLALGRKFARVFRDADSDVCSGRYWTWCRRAGLFFDTADTPDARPEAWYPARLAADNDRFRTIAEYTISAFPGVSLPPYSTSPAGEGRPVSAPALGTAGAVA